MYSLKSDILEIPNTTCFAGLSKQNLLFKF